MSAKNMMRYIFIFILVGIYAFGLNACQLPASGGPQSSSDGFPVPASTEQTSGIDVSKLATQTAIVIPSVTQPTPIVPTSTNMPAYPVATTVPPAPTATATSIVYVEPTQGSLPLTYTVAQGDYPFCLARRFDVNLDELLSINNLTMDSLLSPGDVLKIPQTGDPFEGDRSLHDHPTTYQIKAGDTINSIACYFGDVSPDMIIEQNHLTDNNWGPGDVLTIP
jgi:LysM repeat protein